MRRGTVRITVDQREQQMGYENRQAEKIIYFIFTGRQQLPSSSSSVFSYTEQFPRSGDRPIKYYGSGTKTQKKKKPKKPIDSYYLLFICPSIRSRSVKTFDVRIS